MSTRYDNDRARGIANRPLGQQSEAEMRWQDFMAHQAETWVRAYFGQPPPRVDRPDRGFDLILPDGRKADVKWSSTTPGKWYGSKPGYPTLNLSTWKGAFRAQVYIGTFAEMPEDFDRFAWAIGWVTLDELRAAPIVTGKYGKPYHALGFDYLHPLDLLLPAAETYDDIPAEVLG